MENLVEKMTIAEKKKLDSIKETIIHNWDILDEETRIELLVIVYRSCGSYRASQDFLDGFLSRTHIQRYVSKVCKRKKKPKESYSFRLPPEISNTYFPIDIDKIIEAEFRNIILKLTMLILKQQHETKRVTQ
jgi:hypothetical protein